MVFEIPVIIVMHVMLIIRVNPFCGGSSRLLIFQLVLRVVYKYFSLFI